MATKTSPRVPLLLTLCALGWTAPAPARGGSPPGVLAPAPSPISLTASDGSGLDLVSLRADAVVEDPLAFTELHLAFHNPENRTREGTFRITLPPGATLSRFAMRIGDRWQEGEVVEQQAARIAYEDFLHHRQDPALLENAAGNEFSARVFPIPPAATKEIVISYSQALPDPREPYVLPLRGLPRLGELSVRAQSGGKLVELERRGVAPDRDFEVPHAGARLGLRDDNLVVARVVPIADGERRDAITSLYVLVDTSASRALGLSDEIGALEGLLAELGRAGDPTVTVAAFDQDVAPVFTGKASAARERIRLSLTARRALGASDVERALGWVGATARHDRAHGARALLVSDGVATAGDTAADKLRARVTALGAAGIERLDALAVGGIRDDVLLSRMVTAGLPRDGVVLDGAQPSAALVRRLSRATRSGVKLAIDGAGWIWPDTLNGIQPGDPVLVYADLPRDRPFALKVDGHPLALGGALEPAPRPLLERAWVGARIARVLEQRDVAAAHDRDLAEALERQAIDLSIRNRVLCPLTSLLVLETEQDYARFGIERRALADILTVGPGGIELVHRTEIAVARTETAAPSFDDRIEMLAGKGARLEMQKDLADKSPAKHKVGKREVSDNPLDGLGEAKAAPMAMADEDSAGVGGGQVLRRQRSPAHGAPNTNAMEQSIRPAQAARAAAAPAPAATSAPPPPSAPLAGVFGVGGNAGGPAGDFRARGPLGRVIAPQSVFAPAAPGDVSGQPALEGRLREVMDAIHAGHAREALARALAWHAADPGDVLALVALGESWEALGDPTAAARAYGSIIDLFPGRADLRRFAGERLERIHTAAALALAIDTYRKAVDERPDHPAGHRLLGFALLKAGHPREAFEAIAVGAARRYPEGRFAGVDQILREDLGLAAAAWIHAEPARAAEIEARLARAGGVAERGPSLRFVLNWETDANDVDFHITDAKGGHAYYGSKHLPSGGDLYADVTTGYGPECFTIRAPAAGRAGPYHLQAHYFSRGPMGYGMGKLQIIDHDGRGNLRFDERPFVIMQDGAFVDLGTVGSAPVGQPVAVRRRTAPQPLGHVFSSRPPTL